MTVGARKISLPLRLIPKTLDIGLEHKYSSIIGELFMKTLVTALTALSLIATPVLAQQRQEFRESDNRHRSNDWVAPLVGGLIIGGMIVNSARKYEEQYPTNTQPYLSDTQPTLMCENYYVQDMNGNYALDSNFRVIVRQRCWYAR